MSATGSSGVAGLSGFQGFLEGHFLSGLPHTMDKSFAFKGCGCQGFLEGNAFLCLDAGEGHCINAVEGSIVQYPELQYPQVVRCCE